MKFIVQDREAGNQIEKFNSIEEATEAVTKFERQDKNDGNFTEYFYEIVSVEEAEKVEINNDLITLYCTKYHGNGEVQYDVDIVETANTFELMEDLKKEFQKILPQITFKEIFQIVDKVDGVIYEGPIESIELNKTFIILYI